jgi:hypothetical protein
MPALRFRILVILGLLAVAWLTATPSAPACPFCMEERGPTLMGDFEQAAMVLVGSFKNARIANGGFEEGTTDFVIEQALKSHDIIKDKKIITLPRYINQPKNKFLIFCEVYKKNIDPYRGEELSAGGEMVKYLSGGLALKDKSQGEKLRYCFDFLNCPEFAVALDAYREFARADYKDYKDMAKKLDPKILVAWLEDEKTPPYRYGLYASLLGHCGTAEHAKLLRKMIDDPEKSKGSGIDGMLASYVMLDPKEGWKYVKEILDESKDFALRYAALRTCRFFYGERPDLIATNDLVKGVALLLKHRDMADFAIEDLRRWKRWEMSDTILDLFGKESHNVGTIRRAILRYALRCPESRAKTFVAEQRKRDAEWVNDTEELLQLEDPAPSTPKTNTDGKSAAQPQGSAGLYWGLGGFAVLGLCAVSGRRLLRR